MYFTIKKLIKFVQSKIYSMICNSSLWKIVSSNSFRSITSSYLTSSVARSFLIFWFFCTYTLDLKIFVLALFLCWDFSSCWLTTTPVGMCYFRSVSSIDWLSFGTSFKNINSQIWSLIWISTSSASGRTATVAADDEPSLSFCFRNSLNTVYTRFIFQIWIDIIATDGKYYFWALSHTWDINYFNCHFFWTNFSYNLNKSEQNRKPLTHQCQLLFPQ